MGMGLTVNEAVLRNGPERPYMIFLFAGMMGLPLYLRNDDKNALPTPGEVPALPPRPSSHDTHLEFRGFFA